MLSDEDIAEIKARHPLSDYLAAAGMEFKRTGHGSLVASCPFHREDTASFHVYPDHHYHCYGCAANGDIFTFLRETQGMTFLQAADHLRGAPQVFLPRPAVAVAAKPNAPSHRLSDSRWQRWEESCDEFAANEAEVDRIARWRGFSHEIIVNAARHRLMSTWRYWDTLREAFLITAPAFCCEELLEGQPRHHNPVPVGIHVRLAPMSPGNSHPKKPSWHYDPKSSPEKPIRSWPFLWGNPIGARWHFVLEGQWDALAFADAVGWRSPDALPPGCVIIGLRGSTGIRRYLQDSVFPPKACAICIGDNDVAGESWHDEGGLLDQLRATPTISQVLSFRPNESGCKDLNDLHKKGLFDAQEFLALVRRRLNPDPRRPKRETFLKFCLSICDREDEVGKGARLVIQDKARPKGRKSLRRWRAHWAQSQLESSMLRSLEAAYAAWASSAPAADILTTQPSPSPAPTPS